jgi:hypothetical protein
MWLLGETRSLPSAEGLGYRNDKYDESPGLYYEQLGETALYNTEWKTIVYIDLEQTEQETDQVEQYVDHVIKLCHLTEIHNWTDCNHFSIISKDTLKQLRRSERLLRELIGNTQPSRRRRGVFNFIGEVSKILFGTLDSDDADFYNEQIKHFEENSEDVTSLMKQQLSIVKATLGTFNETISDMEYNNQVINNGLNNLKSYMEKFTSNTELRMNILEIKITVEGHIARINNSLNAMQRNLDLLIESVINAHKGVIQPQLIAPSLIMEALKGSVSSFPKETMAPFISSKDSISQLMNICDIRIYVKNGKLACHTITFN